MTITKIIVFLILEIYSTYIVLYKSMQSRIELLGKEQVAYPVIKALMEMVENAVSVKCQNTHNVDMEVISRHILIFL